MKKTTLLALLTLTIILTGTLTSGAVSAKPCHIDSNCVNCTAHHKDCCKNFNKDCTNCKDCCKNCNQCCEKTKPTVKPEGDHCNKPVESVK